MKVPRIILFFVVCLCSVAIGAETKNDAGQKLPFADLQKKAAKFGTVLTLPTFENTPAEVAKTTDSTIAKANKALDAIGRLDPNKVTFQNTFRALDDIQAEVTQEQNRIGVLSQAHPSAQVREAAIEADQKFSVWAVGVEYRKDVYKAVKAFAATTPNLQGEDRRLFNEQLRDYKRAGLDLPEDQQKDVEDLRKELAKSQTLFEFNVNNAATPVKFTRAELEGVPDSLLTKLKTGEDEYVLDANVTFQMAQVMDNAVNEETRKKLYIARDNRARAKNIDLLRKVLELRADIAHKLGYNSWADYETETRMAKTGETALGFLEKLKDGLEPKYRAELAEFKQIKAASKGSTTPDVNIWDWRYCAEQLRQQKYQIDAEALRVYFPFENVLQGMFNVYERIFAIRIREVQPPSKYVDDLRLYAVIDRDSGAPLGMLYMDMFPRPGKFHHFANFSLIDGKRLENGKYQRPTTALICNFPPPTKDGPSLMSHDEVTTIFHEFGHAMHAILTQAKYVRFAGTNVPRDFVEAPSQMLEYFTWDKKVLDSFAADYRDPSKKIPQEVLTQLKAADLATKGCFYRRQLSFGILDLTLHGGLTEEQLASLPDFSNRILGEVFLPPDPSTAVIASFDHLMGYGAGYYGYAWADAIAADMASVFQAAPDGFLDAKIGRRLRDEIYAQGNSREITVSIERFLRRKQSIDPFLKHVGIQ
ncbi:MAG: Zn-dependent oligopeptidase [Verrucomicrobia bacterium]|nr:Zn-dependent oligopeptidase [Verrucomicrobiota bacterium]